VYTECGYCRWWRRRVSFTTLITATSRLCQRKTCSNFPPPSGTCRRRPCPAAWSVPVCSHECLGSVLASTSHSRIQECLNCLAEYDLHKFTSDKFWKAIFWFYRTFPTSFCRYTHRMISLYNKKWKRRKVPRLYFLSMGNLHVFFRRPEIII